MKSPERIQEALRDRNLKQVAKDAEVSYNALYRMATYTKPDGSLPANPALVEKVEDYLTEGAEKWLA